MSQLVILPNNEVVWVEKVNDMVLAAAVAGDCKVVDIEGCIRPLLLEKAKWKDIEQAEKVECINI